MSMRILHVNKFLYRRGGAEAYMLDLAGLQEAQGHEVAFFGMRHPRNGQQRFSDHFPSEVELEPPPPGVAARARAVGRMFWSTSARRGLASVIEDFDPDVVHLHNIYHQLSPSILAACRAGRVPTVMTLHDMKLACPRYLMLDKGALCDACVTGGLRQAPIRRCHGGSLVTSTLLAAELGFHRLVGAYDPVDVFICPSRFLMDKMRSAGVYPDRLALCHNFVELADVPTKSDVGGPVVYASRLAPEKGVDTLIDAIGRLPDARLEIAGDGPARPDLEAQAARVAPGQVRFLGRLAKEQVSELLRRAGAVAVPSRCYENQPLAVLEAFAAGVPVAGSGIGGIAELVTDGETGYTAPPNDAAGLAVALAKLLADPQAAADLGRAGRARIEAEYDPVRHLGRVSDLYDRAATRRPEDR